MKEMALQEAKDREREQQDPKIELERVVNHEVTKKLVANLKQFQLEKKELILKIDDLNDQLKKKELIGALEEKDGLNSKIKHFQKVKEENNFLK